MKIIDWSLHFYALPYHREVVWANAVEKAGTFALLHVKADNGAQGIAEGTIKPTWSGVSPRSLKAALEDYIMPRLLSVDVAEPDAVTLALAGIPENRLAKGMADTACWGLRAMAADKPLWRLLGGAPLVDLTWAITRMAPHLMAKEAGEMCAKHGFRTLKVKGGQGTETDLAALREIRAAVGESVTLYVDANSAYPSSEALSYVRAIGRAGAVVAEDPCPLQPDHGFEALREEGGLPILVDRNCTSIEDARRFLERGANALSAKPGRIGLSEARSISSLAGRRGARVAVGLYAESALGTLLSLQYAASVPLAQRLVAAEQTFYLTMTDQVIGQDLVIRDGSITLPEVADLTTQVDWDKVKRYALG